MAVIEVAIGPGGVSGRFKVEVTASPAGEATAIAALDADALLARRGLLQQEVLASSVRTRGVPETEQVLREAGQALFAGLLGAERVTGCYRASAALAAERGEELQVVLRIDDPALAGLPWEAMFDQELGTYVCRRDQLVRHVPVPSPPAPLQVQPPLRILGVASSPRGLYPLDVDKEKDQLARALARPASQGLAEVHWAPDATWAALQDLLMDGEWHVLHYIGHGDFDPDRGEGVLALEREDGRADLVSARRLVDLLRQARPMPRLIVLNSCAGAATGASDLFSGTAAALVRGGVSAVAAMQYRVSDDAAIAFARGFYAAIARGRGVDDAVSSGRVAILGTSDHTLEWVTPVLYLRGNQTRLFTLPSPVATATTGLSAAAAEQAAPDAPSPLARTLTGDANEVLPVLNQRGTDTAYQFPFTANAEAGIGIGGVAHKNREPARIDRARVNRILDDAERIAWSITSRPVFLSFSSSKESVLASVAGTLAATDPDRAERIAGSLTGKDEASALESVAGTLAAIDPDRAERIARSITDVTWKASALASIAGTLAATDPDRAARLSADAEQIARSSPFEKESALARVAAALAATDPDRAERIAGSITGIYKASALSSMVRALAATDPDRAGRIAGSITDDLWKAPALASVAEALAATDPDRAERIARSIRPITSELWNASALACVAGALAATDPDRAARLSADAERIARSITSERERASALACVAGALATTDPDRAARLSADAERIASSLTSEGDGAPTLEFIAMTLATTDPDRAERIARSITSEVSKASALAKIAEAWSQGWA